MIYLTAALRLFSLSGRDIARPNAKYMNPATGTQPAGNTNANNMESMLNAEAMAHASVLFFVVANSC